MVVVDYLDLIEQGVDAWNRWRSEHPNDCPELEAVYLFEQSLPGINLRNANLMRACLIGADLSGADLTGANLSGVYANAANFQGACLASANVQDGSLMEADFRQADLSHAQFENTNLTDARLTGACLAGWSVVALAQLDSNQQAEAQIPQLPEADQSESLLETPLSVPLAPLTSGLSVGLKSWQVRLGIGAIALAAILSLFHLTTRSPSNSAVTTVDVDAIKQVCQPMDSSLPLPDVPDHRYQDGTHFYGSFKNGQPADGHGVMLYANGNRYEGEYRHGQRNGCGTFTFQNGRRYVGEFKNDLFSGRGSWILENGDRYIGDFEYNKCNGEGVFIFADGSSKSGVWQQGRLVGGDLSCDRSPTDQSKS